MDYISQIEQENRELKKWKKINAWTAIIGSTIALLVLGYAILIKLGWLN